MIAVVNVSHLDFLLAQVAQEILFHLWDQEDQEDLCLTIASWSHQAEDAEQENHPNLQNAEQENHPNL